MCICILDIYIFSTYLLKWFKLLLLGMLWSYNFSWQTLVLLLYYTRVQITAILLWDSTIVPIICNIEQEVYVHQHLETYLYSKKPYSCCHAGLFKVYIKIKNEGKFFWSPCSILNFSDRFPLNWLVCDMKVQEFFFFKYQSFSTRV